MKAQNLHKIFAILLFVLSLNVSAQNVNCFFDSGWKLTTKENASFYRISTPQDDKTFLIEDFHLNGKIQMRGYSKESTCEDSLDKFVKECTWFEEDGSISFYKKYDETGEEIYSKEINGSKEYIIETKANGIKSRTAINTKTGFKEVRIKTEDEISSTIYCKDVKLKEQQLDNTGITHTKYYDFNGKLIYEYHDNSGDALYEIDYLPTMYKKITLKNNEKIKEETFDKSNNRIATLDYKDSYPYNGTDYNEAYNSGSIYKTEYKEGEKVSETYFYDNGQIRSKQDFAKNEINKQITFYNRAGKQLSVLTFEDNKAKNGSLYLGEKLIISYQNGISKEVNAYYDTDNHSFLNTDDYLYELYDYSNTHTSDSNNLQLIYTQKNGEIKYYDAKGNYLSTLKLIKNSSDYDYYKNRWENFEGRYYTNLENLDYDSYSDYKNGEIIFDRRKSYDEKFITEKTFNLDNTNITKVFNNRNSILLESTRNKDDEIISQKTYQNKAIMSEFSSNPKNGTLIAYNSDEYETPYFVSEYKNGTLIHETSYTYKDNKKIKNYEYKNNQVSFYTPDGKIIAQANVINKKPMNGTILDVLNTLKVSSEIIFQTLHHLETYEINRMFDDAEYTYDNARAAVAVVDATKAASIFVQNAVSKYSSLEPIEVKSDSPVVATVDTVSVGDAAADYNADYTSFSPTLISIKNGNIDGEVKVLTDDFEKVQYTAQYTEGQLNGAEKFFNANGKIVQQNNYKNGVLDGESFTDTKALGEKINCTYSEGKPINGKTYNYGDLAEYKNGVLIKKTENYRSEEISVVYTLLKDENYKAEVFKNNEKVIVTNVSEPQKESTINGEVQYFNNGKVSRTVTVKDGKLINGTIEIQTYKEDYNKIVITCIQANQYTFIYYNDDKIVNTTQIKSDSDIGTKSLQYINHLTLSELVGYDYDY